MKFVKFTILAGAVALFASCGNGEAAKTDTKTTVTTSTNATPAPQAKADTPVASPAKPDTSGKH